MSIKTAVLGYPRIGLNRELKKATEAFWKGELTREALEDTARQIRKSNWELQKQFDIDFIPSNDFSFYDQMLDMTALLGLVPEGFHWKGGQVDLDTYFDMARGVQEKEGVVGKTVSAMEMTKWFDTNYHYIVPEFHKNQRFQLASDKPIREFKEALALGIKTRPVLPGPITFLKLGKKKEDNFSIYDLLDPLLEVYINLLNQLKSAGAEWVQIDEPILVTELDAAAQAAFKKTYDVIARKAPGLSLMLTTYFGSLADNLPLAVSLPVQGIHVDLVRGEEQLEEILEFFPKDKWLSLGVVNGRNIWKSNLAKILGVIETAFKKRGGGELILAPSCSLLHVPLDLEMEKKLDQEFKSWLAYAKQKLAELKVLKKAVNKGKNSVSRELAENQQAISNREQSPRIHKTAVKARLGKIRPEDYTRKNAYKVRRQLQRSKLDIPLYPTTTIGSFPQTPEVRQARAKFKKGELSQEQYSQFVKEKIQDVVKRQTEIGLDVLVHGEFERNDMVEYFGELLEGFAFTEHGWVQSYGSRYVKPPVIFGDIERLKPMTVDWTVYAQSLTDRIMKGMLTGPITILQWSFVRDDQPRSETARQIALAIRDEVRDLEKAGIRIIQIDEPALREGLPLRRSEWQPYLKWAVECFRLSSSCVQDETQIHTHMCYSEFNDIIESIADLDADAISIETSRSQMELLDAFVKFRYPNEIGPGVYDIHSPRVPSVQEIEDLLKKASDLLPVENIWVNPDCGLKTRGWNETTLALKAMVQAAKTLRSHALAKASRHSE